MDVGKMGTDAAPERSPSEDLSALLAVLASPTETQKRLVELREATDAAKAAREAADAALAEADRRRTEAEAAEAKASAERRALAAERREWTQHYSDTSARLAAEERRIADLDAAAQQERKALDHALAPARLAARALRYLAD